MLEIKKLTKYYKNIKGVKNLDLKLKNGEIFGFIGPNGAGKSTTIRSIMNIIHKNNGKVYVDGKLFTEKEISLKENIGYLPSEINLYEDLTVKQMLKYSASFYKEDCDKKMQYLSNKLKLNVNKKISDLSYGNLKKVGIVLAMMHNPKLLIMDEPTSGLDPLIQETFFELLKEEKKRGTTILYSTHILSEVKKICDRVGIIKDGKLIKIDSINNLVDNHLNIITITCNDKKLLSSFNNVISKKNNSITFIYEKDINLLIKQLNKYQVEKLLIEEPSLEEVFMHYYK